MGFHPSDSPGAQGRGWGSFSAASSPIFSSCPACTPADRRAPQGRLAGLLLGGLHTDRLRPCWFPALLAQIHTPGFQSLVTHGQRGSSLGSAVLGSFCVCPAVPWMCLPLRVRLSPGAGRPRSPSLPVQGIKTLPRCTSQKGDLCCPGGWAAWHRGAQVSPLSGSVPGAGCPLPTVVVSPGLSRAGDREFGTLGALGPPPAGCACRSCQRSL